MYPIIEFSDDLYIPTYLLLISLVYSAGLFWIVRRAENQGFSVPDALDLCLYVMIGGLLGARLLHVVYESPDHYLHHPHGRVVNISSNYSSIMLLNDPNSRVPIVTSTSRARGILAKQGDNMLLIYLPEEHNVKIGELVYTSGDGKVYPYGLLVGKVKKITNDGVFVELSANLNKIEFVTVTSR